MRMPAGELPLARELASAVAQRGAAGMLQRDTAPGPLTAGQVTKAIGYYKSQPQAYSVVIMLQIQEAVGVEPTGIVDAQTVQAVAVWQRDNGATPPEQKLPGVVAPPPLVVDGMAGPRTLPRLFAHGLNVKSEGLAFGKASQTGVIDKWHELTPKQRAEKLVELVNVHLKKAEVPSVIPALDEKTSNSGSFSFSTWQMKIGLKALEIAQPTVEQARDLVDTIYHEARHAEQWFRIAQLRAMQLRKKNPKATDAEIKALIVKETKIQADAVEAAIKKPLPEGSMQALIAQGWYDSVYGKDRPHRRAVFKELKAAAAELEKAEKAVEKNDTPANRAALAKAEERDRKVTAAYKNLPEENDAWATGPMTGPGVTSGAPAPPPPADPALGGIEKGVEELVGAGPLP